jgi:hypothetical protein
VGIAHQDANQRQKNEDRSLDDMAPYAADGVLQRVFWRYA